MDSFGILFGGFLYEIYSFTGRDYGIALIIFTIIIKLILMPLSVKQIKSSMRMQELQPELKRLQEQYKHDREKLNEEMIKFFQTNNYNPANGCIMPFLQLPVLILLYQIIIKPVSYLLKGDAASVQALMTKLNVADEIGIIFAVSKSDSAQFAGTGVSQELINKIIDLHDGMYFLGIMNLAKIPSYDPSVIATDLAGYVPLIILIVLAAIFTYLSSKLMFVGQNNYNPPAKGQQTMGPIDPAMMQKSMLFMGPVFTLIFGFQFPAGLALYWLAQYVFQVFQQLYINKTLYAKKETEVSLIKSQDNKLDLQKEQLKVPDGTGNENKLQKQTQKQSFDNKKKSQKNKAKK